MTTRFTIALCVYNGERLLSAVLNAISQQVLPTHGYEILLVDNNSSDRTKDIYLEFAENNNELSCRYILETRPGQANARSAAIENSIGEWLVFVDDDNLLNRDYLLNADNFIRKNSDCGIDIVTFGGISLQPEGIVLPKWFSEISSAFAIWNGGDVERELIGTERCFTAGLLVRRDIAVRCNKQKTAVSGRTQSNPVGGEDLELSLKILKMGYKRYYCPTLIFVHQISENRINYPAVKSLYMTFGANRLVLGSIYNTKGYNYFVYSIYILAASFCKLPMAFISAIFCQSNKMANKSILWVYMGVFKYLRYSYACLRKY